VVLAIDQSGSMQARDAAPSRLEVARDAARAFLDDVPDELRVGGVLFNHEVQSAQAPTVDRDAMHRMIDSLRSSGGTATGEALASSLRLLESGPSDRRPPPGAIVLLSDGASTHGRDPVQFARDAGSRRIPVYTVALGTDQGTIRVERPGGAGAVERVPPDRETLRRIADLSGGRYHEAAEGSELEEVYERLGSQVSTRPEQREITAGFAAGAALLLLGGAAASLRWFGRLP
jgi:Ca-activated chloride channel family protein